MQTRRKSPTIAQKRSITSLSRKKTAQKRAGTKGMAHSTKLSAKRASGSYTPRVKAGRFGAEERRGNVREEKNENRFTNNHGLYELFLKELACMYSAENQIVEALPKLINSASARELKEALKNHLNETKNQVTRLDQIFSLIGKKPMKNTSEDLKALIETASKLIKNQPKGATLDAAIISAAQKVEHYEMAAYGTLRSFANNLKLDSEVASLLQETLDEEGAADKKLTKIAEGSLFTSGINKEAAAHLVSRK